MAVFTQQARHVRFPHRTMLFTVLVALMVFGSASAQTIAARQSEPQQPPGPWIVTNGAALIGHAITLLVFLGGFFVLRSQFHNDLEKMSRQNEADILKDRGQKYYERLIDSVVRNTKLMETIRSQMFLLAVQPFDRQQGLDPAIERRLQRIAALRGEFFGTSLFMHPQLRPFAKRVSQSFDQLNEAVITGDPKVLESANDRADFSIKQWKSELERWIQDEGEKLGLWERA